MFMPVGTRAGVNCMTVEELQDCGSEIILGGNTYHMLIAPGLDIITKAGGMHRFMAWHGPMLTDSGGFQIFSLSRKEDFCTIDEEGAHFTHPKSLKRVDMTPETSLKTQKTIGADIIMAFDQCTPDSTPIDEAKLIMERTHRWLRQSKEYHLQHPCSDYGDKQALFGIIQGGVYQSLREQSAEFVISQDLDGVAIGGESIGFNMPMTTEILSWLKPYLPMEKVRYAMGVGLNPQDLCDVVKHGVDIFDCVAPTRNARHGALYSGDFVIKDNWLAFESEFKQGRLQIKQSAFAFDERPIMADCHCFTCQHYTRAHLHYLFKQRTVLFANLASIHNVAVMVDACKRMQSIILGSA